MGPSFSTSSDALPAEGTPAPEPEPAPEAEEPPVVEEEESPAEAEEQAPARLRITRVYTKTGDDGKTGLVGGQRVGKNDPRIEAYGTVDELAAALGAARLAVETENGQFESIEQAEMLDSHLQFIQNQLFTLGGDLATQLEDRHPQMPLIGEAETAYLERLCDSFNAELEPLQDFILAGGSSTAVALHQARTIARRAERRTVTLSMIENIGPHATVYLNRLSDALFVLARWANRHQGMDETTWQRDQPEPAMPESNETE
ncbi:cob(I)yrinic acid a,c-diamide adenosyltransferase [bacterium]|nr:cob(I)yrinic acid a,c-diamide adenosyltransferase [bacterium]